MSLRSNPGLLMSAISLALWLAVSERGRADDVPAQEADARAKAAVESSANHPTDEAAQDKQPGHGTDTHGGAGSHGDHDPTDLSHQNASPALENPADPWQLMSDLAIWTFVVFVLLLFLLAKFAWGPIVEGLQRREQAVADMIERARLDAEAANKQLAEYERKLAAAVEESREIVAEARRDAEAAGQKILENSKAEAERQLVRAKAEIEAAKNAAIQQLAAGSVNTAVALAGRMLHKEIKAADHAQLIREAIDQFPSKN